MDLTVNSKVIASVQVQAVQLIPILGAFELTFSYTSTIHGMSDGLYRCLTIAGARVTMRTRKGHLIELGRAVPDNDTVIRQVNNTSRMDFALKLVLHPYQLERLEAERDGGDLSFVLKLLARGSTSQNDGGAWDEHTGDMAVQVPESAWIAQLNQSKAARLLLLEIRLPNGPLRHPSEHHLLRAQELLAEGDWRNCVSECRQFAEELGGDKLVPATQMFCNDRRAMTKDQRETLVLASLQHYGHIATHSESKQGELDYSRADAKLALSLAACLAEHHFSQA